MNWPGFRVYVPVICWPDGFTNPNLVVYSDSRERAFKCLERRLENGEHEVIKL